MPILEVEIVINLDEELPTGLASELAASAAKIFGSPPGQTWVKLKSLPRMHYAEDGLDPTVDIRPVFVSVLKRLNPPAQEMVREVGALTRTIGQACGRPEQNVHILYEPPAAGRLAFGGRIVVG
jgi:phenylpyruvate tautomerase PptA (4-oxalocrotonate tautomerase family)